LRQKVSVIIPAYNIAPFLADTLDSLFAKIFGDSPRGPVKQEC
jgi:glycosyltransferase involved in cell wall biosynthesis